MIKLLYEFDKMISKINGEGFNRLRIQQIIADDLSGIDIDSMVCPFCENEDISWKYRFSRTSYFIWEDPAQQLCVDLPVYAYQCPHCKRHGTETISTDITISHTDLSFHYIIMLMRTMSRAQNTDIIEFTNLMYGYLREDSLNLWRRRFSRDGDVLCSLFHCETDDILDERITFGDAFKQFYLQERRFFLHEQQVNMLIYPDPNGHFLNIRKFFKS